MYGYIEDKDGYIEDGCIEDEDGYIEGGYIEDKDGYTEEEGGYTEENYNCPRKKATVFCPGEKTMLSGGVGCGQDSVPGELLPLPDNVSLPLEKPPLHQLCQQAGSLARTQYIIFDQRPLCNRLEGTRKGTERQFTKTQLALKFEKKFNLTHKKETQSKPSVSFSSIRLVKI